MQFTKEQNINKKNNIDILGFDCELGKLKTNIIKSLRKRSENNTEESRFVPITYFIRVSIFDVLITMLYLRHSL